jgi:hypothetical protein
MWSIRAASARENRRRQRAYRLRMVTLGTLWISDGDVLTTGVWPSG